MARGIVLKERKTVGMAVEKIGGSQKESVHLFFSDAELQSYLCLLYTSDAADE